TTVEDVDGDKWQQTDKRLRFDAVPRQETTLMGGGIAEERSSARQQDTEGFPTSLHEVTVTAVTDPETQQQVLLVVQTDVSERSAVEERLMALTAAQMTMLEAMFPRHIMEQIASHGATSNLTEKASGGNGWQNVATMDLSKLATHHECVTIMFTDIVGFTAFSKECTPGQVMSFLNELFSKMDGLLDKHNVYKVETAGGLPLGVWLWCCGACRGTDCCKQGWCAAARAREASGWAAWLCGAGDCYIICGGLLDEDEDGFKTVASGSPTRVAKIKAARRALNFAVEMMRVASTVMMPNTGKPVVLRAGLHSGPVVSGLVGSRLPKFSLFGDTMNTASRMESTSVPGRIQVSQATYELLRDPRPSRWQPTGGVQ
ncbi:guanylate cyclase domain-containing protein, partial [Haematococcus lacustris]